jgi:hypothetical protein
MRQSSTQHPPPIQHPASAVFLSRQASTHALMIVIFSRRMIRARLRYEFRRNRMQAKIPDDVTCGKAGGRGL